jgi:alpha-galactosidase
VKVRIAQQIFDAWDAFMNADTKRVGDWITESDEWRSRQHGRL